MLVGDVVERASRITEMTLRNYFDINLILIFLQWNFPNYYLIYIHISRNGDSEDNPRYILSFLLEFPHDMDNVYLAYNYPYTYTNLQDYLIKLKVDSS